MKNIVVAMAIAVGISFSPAFGADRYILEYCSALSEYSESVMSARQKGHSMRKVVSRINADELEYHGLTLSIIQDAYEHPKLSFGETQQEIISEFGSETYLRCLKQLS